MIVLLDILLRDLFATAVPGVAAADVSFEPPDAAWRQSIRSTNRNALSAYLVELRENRKLRTTERRRHVANGTSYEEEPLMRLDCHYLISAWSPALVTPGTDPALDEHQLLYDVAAALVRAAPLNPSRVPTAAWPAPFGDIDLLTAIAPPEGFTKLAEFWNGMGRGAVWKPVVHLVVTVPLELLRITETSLVTTMISDYRQDGRLDTSEVLMQIGGHVLDTTAPLAPAPLRNAWVRLETTSGTPLSTARSNALGRFTFLNLRGSRYLLRVRASGFPEKARIVDVPSPTGEYDVRLP